jgi:ferritin-like metal-binding protein YciE
MGALAMSVSLDFAPPAHRARLHRHRCRLRLDLGGIMQEMADDTLVKGALQDHSTEHMEIASYKALIVAADDLGHPEIAETCRGILRDEEAMAAWLDEQLPTIVRETLAGQHA